MTDEAEATAPFTRQCARETVFVLLESDCVKTPLTDGTGRSFP